MGTITRRKNGHYQVKIRRGGSSFSRAFQSLDDARRWERAREVDLDRGVDFRAGCRALKVDQVNSQRAQLGSIFLWKCCCAPAHAATVTPFRVSTSNNLGISGGPVGISLLMAVNIWVAREPCPVISSIWPPPVP